MDDLLRSKIIGDNPIGNGLDAFRKSFVSICEGAGAFCTPDTFANSSEHRKYVDDVLKEELGPIALRVAADKNFKMVGRAGLEMRIKMMC
ncbi:hypothetical protein BN1708_014620 [Verticillium longisporum]|uniref:Uncharacterized protein n=1 Tax=Verticillium longisporum TaxID=100787 RepID=A0A0G4LXF3_VERLO|nr:hypothetical protein BN1708_014620 [Verticillium longisporum]